MEQIRNIHLNCRYMVDEHVNEQEEEEEDEDDDDKSEDDNNDQECEAKDNPQDLTPQNKEQLQNEFRSQMVESFILGKDKDHFDYSEVDSNENYDMSSEFERDQEDRYFEED